jgi:signal transduction histidine kinase
MRSLQRRLSTGLITSLIVIFIVLLTLVSHAIRHVSEDYIASRLEHDSETMLSAISFPDTGPAHLDSVRIDGIYRRPYSGHYYLIQAGDTVFRSRSLWDHNLSVPLDSREAGKRLHLQGPQNQPLLALITHYHRAGQEITIAVAEDLTDIEAQVTRFQQVFTFVALLLFFIMVTIQALLVYLGLRPIEAVREDIRKLEQGSVEKLSNQVPSEIQPLVNEVNRLLQLMHQRMTRSRNALGDLAHALKKPLTVIRQVRQDPVVKGNDNIRTQLEQQTEDMAQSIERYLRRARLAGEGPAGSYYSLTDDLPPLLSTLQQIYADKALRIEPVLPNIATLPIDREDLQEMLGNLLDNACKWARSRVRLSIESNHHITITIEDDGPGVSDEESAQLLMRGNRLDESVLGHGLGLAIVKDIVDQYDGKVKIESSPELQGFYIQVQLDKGSMHI